MIRDFNSPSSGYHTYAPAQAETNYDLVAFTFTGSGAVPRTVQVWTRAGDAYTRLGAPSGASVSADLAAVTSALSTVDGVVDAVKAKTDNLTFSLSGKVDANLKGINDNPFNTTSKPYGTAT